MSDRTVEENTDIIVAAIEAPRSRDGARFKDLRRVTDKNGGWIEPPLGQHWDDATKLEWRAAIIRYDHGIQINVYVSRRRGYFGFNSRAWSTSDSYTFERAWTYLNGIGTGADLVASRQTEDES